MSSYTVQEKEMTAVVQLPEDLATLPIRLEVRGPNRQCGHELLENPE